MKRLVKKRQPAGPRRAEGPGGKCYCVVCGYTSSHTVARPCSKRKCPRCGFSMTRK